MRASIIVVAYNSRPYLRACLDSVQRDMAADDEIIVVDNASSDGSADLVAEYFPAVRLVRADNNGYAGGNNRGAALARGAVLVFLNPDTVLEPGALTALVAPLAEDAGIGLTTACIVHMDRPDVINTCGNTMHYTGLTYCRGAGQPRAAFARSVDVDAVSGAACAIRRKLFVELGGFDQRFFMYCEDTDLSWRARTAGLRCRYVAEAVVRHDYRPAYTPSKAFFVDRNRHLMVLQNVRRSTYARMLPGLLLAEVVTWGFNLISGPRFWGVKPQVYRWLWANHRMVRAAASPDDRTIVRRLTHRLEFGQLAHAGIAKAAGMLFHPLFRAAQLVVAGRSFVQGVK